MDPTFVDLSVRTGQFVSENSEIPPDITFKFNESEDDEVKAHKVYLAMVSRIFRNMFFVHDTEDRLADVLVMEDTTKPPFQVMIHAIYHFKSMKESLKGMSVDEIFAVLYLVTKYEIPEMVLAVGECLSTFPVSDDNVLEVATDAMEFTSTFEEYALKLLLSCAKFLNSKLTDAELPFQALIEFMAENGNHMATVHKLAVLMKDLPPLKKCSGCLRKPTECLNGKKVTANDVLAGVKVIRNPKSSGRRDESQGVGVIVRKDERKENHWFIRWENNEENGDWLIETGGYFLFKCDICIKR